MIIPKTSLPQGFRTRPHIISTPLFPGLKLQLCLSLQGNPRLAVTFSHWGTQGSVWSCFGPQEETTLACRHLLLFI